MKTLFTITPFAVAAALASSGVAMAADQSVGGDISTIVAAVSDHVKPTLLVGVVGLPGIDRAQQLPTDDLDAFGGKRSITKAVKAAAKKATKATPALAKATKAVNAIKGIPAVVVVNTTVQALAPGAWALGSKLGEKWYGQSAGPYPGLVPALIGK